LLIQIIIFCFVISTKEQKFSLELTQTFKTFNSNFCLNLIWKIGGENEQRRVQQLHSPVVRHQQGRAGQRGRHLPTQTLHWHRKQTGKNRWSFNTKLLYRQNFIKFALHYEKVLRWSELSLKIYSQVYVLIFYHSWSHKIITTLK